MLNASCLSLPSRSREQVIGTGDWMCGHSTVHSAHRWMTSPPRNHSWTSVVRQLGVAMNRGTHCEISGWCFCILWSGRGHVNGSVYIWVETIRGISKGLKLRIRTRRRGEWRVWNLIFFPRVIVTWPAMLQQRIWQACLAFAGGQGHERGRSDGG